MECRHAIAPFAELERSPEHISYYRLTSLGIWNARAAGHDAEQVIDTLLKYSRYAVPHSILVDVAEDDVSLWTAPSGIRSRSRLGPYHDRYCSSRGSYSS
ncbi:MAG: helicase-associated domain-containing protein [Actinomycetota bacterium]